MTAVCGCVLVKTVHVEAENEESEEGAESETDDEERDEGDDDDKYDERDDEDYDDYPEVICLRSPYCLVCDGGIMVGMSDF